MTGPGLAALPEGGRSDFAAIRSERRRRLLDAMAAADLDVLILGRPGDIVFAAGYSSPVRTPRGRDILAACGQLKSATEKLSARERLALRAMAMTD